MYSYETRVQHENTEFTVLSKNGLVMEIKASVRFFPDVHLLPYLHKEVGPEYVKRVVIPQIQSVIRKILGSYEPQQIYGTQGSILQNITLYALGELKERFILLDELLIRELKLPDSVSDSIERKLQQEQYYLEYTYRLQAEEEEVKRKKEEAKGILEISKSLSKPYLEYLGIKATLDLAKSNNTKVVVIGNKENGMPILFNTDSTKLNNHSETPKPEEGKFSKTIKIEDVKK